MKFTKIFWYGMAFLLYVLLCIGITAFISKLRVIDFVFGLAIVYLLIKSGELKIEWESGKKKGDAERKKVEG